MDLKLQFFISVFFSKIIYVMEKLKPEPVLCDRFRSHSVLLCHGRLYLLFYYFVYLIYFLLSFDSLVKYLFYYLFNFDRLLEPIHDFLYLYRFITASFQCLNYSENHHMNAAIKCESFCLLHAGLMLL